MPHKMLKTFTINLSTFYVICNTASNDSSPKKKMQRQ